MQEKFKIEGKSIGDGHPTFLIAEISSNHNRNKTTVKKLINYAAESGFDAVKFQIYDAEEAFSKHEMTTNVGLDHIYGVRPWWKVARDKILMPRNWFGEMFDYVRKVGLIPLSAIHREEDCKFLLQFKLPAIKIASIDLNYYHLLEKLPKFKLPMIVSTGMGSSKEIKETYLNLKKWNQKKLALLHCVSVYPPKPENVNLNNIIDLKKKYKLPIGFSDHSSGTCTSVASIALGSNIIEKHITLDKNYPGPDHPFSIEPDEMKKMVKEIREIEKSLGSFQRVLGKEEEKNKRMIRRSIVSSKKILKGEKIFLNKIKFARPGKGMPSNDFYKIEGQIAKKNILAETMIKQSMFKKSKD
jgi:sialic acid synthase SpsE